MMSLRTAIATEGGVRFETGVPVRFVFIRNTERAPRRIRGTGDPYQQSIEPAGVYILHDTARGSLPSRWVRGTAMFRRPVVIPWSEGGERYDERSWKANLARAFRARGKTLSRKILGEGFDGIVTVRDGFTSEIVALDPRTQLVFD